MEDNAKQNNSGIYYTPEKLYDFEVISYGGDFGMFFPINPHDYIDDPQPYIDIVHKRFVDEGWNGKGIIHMVYSPLYMLSDQASIDKDDEIVAWHVKEHQDAIGYVLFDADLL